MNYQTFSKQKQEYFEETDFQFIMKVRKIDQKKKSVSKKFWQQSQVTDQECQKIANIAELHSRANIVNSTTTLTYQKIREIPDIQRCGCGCQKAVGTTFSIFTNQENFSFLGSGVILFFFFIRCLKTMVLMLVVTYATFALVSNIISVDSSKVYQQKYSDNFQKLLYLINQTSTYNVKNSYYLKQIQLWLGFFCSIFWVVGFNIVEFLGLKRNDQIDDMLDSSSDYTIMIENLPQKQIEQVSLYQYVMELWQTREQRLCDNIQLTDNMPLKIKSLQILYNMKDCREIIESIQKYSSQICKILSEDNTVNIKYLDRYLEIKRCFTENFVKIEEFKEKFIQDPIFRSQYSSSTALIQFTNPDQQLQFLSYYCQQYSPISCSNCGSINFKGLNLSIQRAPQPSDFHWHDQEKKFSYLRFSIIWGIIIIIISVAYSLVTFVKTLDFIKSQAAFVVSIILQIFNRIIWITLSFLVTFQYHRTKTMTIKSLMVKSLVAQTINIVVVPMFNSILSNKAIYGQNSIASNSLYYQFIMFFMMFIFYVANPLYFLKKLLLRITYSRNKIIRIISRVIGIVDNIQQIQPVLNFYEGPQFPIAGAYVYIATAMIHTFFYCHLQPLLLLIFYGNMVGFTFIMKYLLFNRCKVPQLVNFQIYKLAIFSIKLGGFFYSVGSIVFKTLEYIRNGTQIYMLDFIPSSLCIFLFMLSFCNVRDINKRLTKLIYRIVVKLNEVQHKQDKAKFDELISIFVISALEKLKIVYERKQSYYEFSSLQILFNYEKQLYETDDIQNIHRKHQIQQFCQKFVKRSKKTERIQKKDKKKNIEVAVNDLIFIPVSATRNPTCQSLQSFRSILIETETNQNNTSLAQNKV